MRQPTGAAVPARHAIGLTFGAPRVTAAVAAASVAMSLAGAASVVSTWAWGDPWAHGLVPMFNLDAQTSLPNLFQTLLILFNALLLAVAALDARRSGGRDGRVWAGLAAVFVWLALDEFAALHTRLNGRVRVALAFLGLGHDAWVVPYILLAGIVAIVTIPFLRRRSPSTRWMMIAAGALFVTSALGFEIVEGLLLDARYPLRSAAMAALGWAEETCEMAGMTLFAHALMHALAGRVELRVRVGGPAPAFAPVPAVSASVSPRLRAAGGEDRVEEQPERRVRLSAVLRAEADEHGAPEAGLRLDHRRPARDGRFALEPPAQQDVLRAVARDDAHPGRVPHVVRRTEREERGVALEHAEGQRLRSVQIEPHQ